MMMAMKPNDGILGGTTTATTPTLALAVRERGLQSPSLAGANLAG
jgi:hypothetical protein